MSESLRIWSQPAAGLNPADVVDTVILDLLDTAILRLDEHHRVMLVNSAAEQALSVGRDRLNGRRLEEVLPLPIGLSEALQPAPSSGQLDGSSLRLHELKLPGGSYDCILTAQPGGGILLELHDLDWEHRRSRLQQRELQTGLLELLARNLGHEIRNPLGGIRGAAQMLASELETPELATLARLIMRETDRIDDLIQSLGRQQMAQEAVAIYPLLDEALGLLATEFSSDVAIERDFDPSIPPIQADPSALRQVMLNLLRNAFESQAGKITLRTRIEHGGALLQTTKAALLRLDVVDDGEGVPEELRQLLFLPMVTGKRGGTGLGLALSQQIAAAHGGLLTYEPMDTPQGTGSRFSLYLPLQAIVQAEESS